MENEQFPKNLRKRKQSISAFIIIFFVVGIILLNNPKLPLAGVAFGYGGGGGGGGGWVAPSLTPPTGGFSIIINDGALETDSQNVTLTLNGGPDAENMMVSNFSDFSGAVSETYQTVKDWTLTEGLGTRTVYVVFYNQWGKSTDAVSDTIILVSELTPTEEVELSPEAQAVDANQDSAVDILDFNLVMVNWGTTAEGNVADFNNDNVIDIFDFNLLMIHWS